VQGKSEKGKAPWEGVRVFSKMSVKSISTFEFELCTHMLDQSLFSFYTRLEKIWSDSLSLSLSLSLSVYSFSKISFSTPLQVRARCRNEWSLFRSRLADAEQAYISQTKKGWFFCPNSFCPFLASHLALKCVWDSTRRRSFA